MAKWFFVFLFAFFAAPHCIAQNNKLLVEGSTPNLYVVHTVLPKENFYSIGRMFNVAPKELAAYNNLQFENGLTIGQPLKIPLTGNNFTQTAASDQSEALVPVYHTVLPKEGLYRVSITYNKVPLDYIKKWNHLPSDEVTLGTPLVIGFLKVSKIESPLASKAVKSSAAANQDGTKPIPPAPIVSDRMPPVKNPNADKKEQQKINEPLHDTSKGSVKITGNSTLNFSGGYFKKLYGDQSANKSPVTTVANAGTFKSTSGWQDGKYYCFNNEATPGTVIKVTESTTNKTIFARVLDAIPDIKQNAGLTIIVSNAGAEELGAGDKFSCTLSYFK